LPHSLINATFAAMKYESSIVMFLLLLPLTIGAQIKGMVVSTETNVPVRDVVITTDRGERTVTAWDGTFLLKDTTFRQLSLGNVHYLRRVVYREELTDTVTLIPDINSLDEVVVIGHARGKAFNRRFSVDVEELKAIDRASPNSGTFSMGELKRLKKKKKLKHLKEVLRNY